MINVLLCGASDTSLVAQAFKDEIMGFGGDPWHYQSGRITYSNSAQSNWTVNSQLSVRNADLCVFVLIKDVGEITWNTELNEALMTGKPFLLFCLKETFQKYLELNRSVKDLTAISDIDKNLILLLRDLDSNRKLTAVPFEIPYFRDELRRHMSILFADSLKLVEIKNQRNNVWRSLKAGVSPTEAEIKILKEIAIDETEDKVFRKRAINSLSLVGIDSDSILELLSSTEQGVKRLCVEHLGELMRQQPIPKDFLLSCVNIANESDDVGISRRLISAILQIDLITGLLSLVNLDLTEIGARRRLATVLEEHESEINQHGLYDVAITLANRCLNKTSDDGWIKRCKELLDRLTEKTTKD